MTTRANITIFIFALAIVPACNNWTNDANYCPGRPNNNCMDPPGACTSDEQCFGDRQVCALDIGQCVECTVENTANCPAEQQACSADHECRVCQEHRECASDVCLPDGAGCADPMAVAYVAANGPGTTAAGCAKDAPCRILADAVATPKQYVKVQSGGVVKDTKETTISGKRVTVLADRGAELDRDGDGPLLVVRGMNTEVTIYDLTITGATTSSGHGVQLEPNGGDPKLSLVRVHLQGNEGAGVDARGGILTVTRSTIATNRGGGVSMTSAGVVSIMNNFIHHNGDTATTSFGGLSLRPMGASKVEFNTIIDNESNLNSTSAGGIFCDTSGFVAANNLIFRNTGGPTGTVQTVGDCGYGNSFNMPGASAADNSLNFVKPNEQPFDYHLSAASPASVLNAAGSCTGEDFDGNQRPLGAACDLGADELSP